jgi:Family of unknown function (DUF6353)
MRLEVMKNAVTSKVGLQVLTTRKYSPEILFGTGIVLTVTTVVLASRATLKMDSVLREAEENEEKIKKAEGLGSENYTDEDSLKDKSLNRLQTGIKIAKLYAPAFAVGLVAVGCLTGSHVILSRRNVALTAAYAAVDRGFKEYRARVVNEYGKEKDREFRYGSLEREIAVETDEGTAVKTIKGIDQTKDPLGYAKIFDESNKHFRRGDGFNQLFVQCQQNYANDLLNGRGHVFLNEVYDMLGFERTDAGQIVGWVSGNGDGYVDFGVFTPGDEFMGKMFVNGDEDSVLLDFNVDGPVYSLLGKNKGK